MKIKLTVLDLHNPFFIGGKNFSSKSGSTLDATAWPLSMEYDREWQEVVVVYKGVVKVIPMSNVASMTPANPAELDIDTKDVVFDPVKVVPSFPPTGKVKAQASGPTDHVFAGKGGGKTLS